MTTMMDIAEEMMKVQRQITFLKSNERKTQEDLDEIFVLNQYYNILMTGYLLRSKNY